MNPDTYKALNSLLSTFNLIPETIYQLLCPITIYQLFLSISSLLIKGYEGDIEPKLQVWAAARLSAGLFNYAIIQLRGGVSSSLPAYPLPFGRGVHE